MHPTPEGPSGQDRDPPAFAFLSHQSQPDVVIDCSYEQGGSWVRILPGHSRSCASQIAAAAADASLRTASRSSGVGARLSR